LTDQGVHTKEQYISYIKVLDAVNNSKFKFDGKLEFLGGTYLDLYDMA
jgi:hypothetical protein